MGFSEEFDEWRNYECGRDYFPFVRLEKMCLPNGRSMEDRKNIFHGQLYRAIKQKLWSGRRDDPKVRIEMNVDPDVFSTGLGQVTLNTSQRGKDIYSATDNRLLDSVLGSKWDERIMNSCGDFACGEKYCSILDNKVKPRYKNTNILVASMSNARLRMLICLSFSFVRGDGNRRQYMERC